MKSITDLFDDVWIKKHQRKWEFIYIMVDLHGVILPSNYHSKNDLTFISPYAQQCLRWLSDRKDVILILWSSSYMEEIQSVIEWLKKNDIIIDYINENPVEGNTVYANFSKKPYFSILLDDKAGFEKSDWEKLNKWISLK